VTGTRLNSDGERGRGVYAEAGSTVTLEGVLVQDNHEVGVGAHESDLVIADTRILDTQLQADGLFGRGLEIYDGSLEASNLRVERNHEVGISLIDASGVLSSTIVRDTESNGEGDLGLGIALQNSSLRVVDAQVHRNREIGLYLDASDVTLDRAHILDTQSDPRGLLGMGLLAKNHSEVRAVDSWIDRSHECGVCLVGSRASLTDSRITRTRRSSQTGIGVGVIAQEGSELELDGVELTGSEGPGLYVMLESTATGVDCVLHDNAFAGVAVVYGSSLALESSTVTGTRVDANQGGGVGLYTYDWFEPNQVQITSSTVGNNELAGIYLQGSGSYQFTDNEVSGGPGFEDVSGRWTHGDGILAMAGYLGTVTGWDPDTRTGLLLEGNTFHDCAGAAVFLDGSGVRLEDNSYVENGVDVLQQACGELEQPEGLDTEPVELTEICPSHDHSTELLDFEIYLEDPNATL
jgi:hypothetical protein